MVESARHRRRRFIGSNFVRHALRTHADWRVTTLDKLTYAGRRENLHDVMDDPRARVRARRHRRRRRRGSAGRTIGHRGALRRGNPRRSVAALGGRLHPHRCRGHLGAARSGAPRQGLQRFIQISTDEVYGSVPAGASSRPTS
jgi:dTDP-glucose 4,6-dehydratase